jgi:hypothetical protein
MELLQIERERDEFLAIESNYKGTNIVVIYKGKEASCRVNKEEAKQIIEHLTKVFELNEEKTEGLSDNKIDQEFGDNNRPILVNKLFSDDLNNQLDQAEKRMNVIGQNGNDGLHYQFWEEMNNNLMNKDRNLDIWESDH